MHLKTILFYILVLYQTRQGQFHATFLSQSTENEVTHDVFENDFTHLRRSVRSDNDTSPVLRAENATTQQKSVKKDLPKQTSLIAPLPINDANQAEIKAKPLSTALANNTASVEDTNQLKPGTVKRGIIVFGSLTFLFIGYMAYKIWRKSVDSNKDNYLSETQIFKYGVLKSDDNPENMELARMPLTVDSEDDDDDDDLEIFDLEHNRRLQTSKEIYGNSGKSDIQILDLELPDQNKNQDKNFVLLDLNNDGAVSSTSKARVQF